MLTQNIHVISGEIVFRVDPLALLSATLKTYQRAVCDTDQVVLTCPRGTSISIEVAQFSKQDDGISIDELCPLNEGLSSPKQIIIGSTNANNNDSYKSNFLSNNFNTINNSEGNSNNNSSKNNLSNIYSNNSSKINNNINNNSNSQRNDNNLNINETNYGEVFSTEVVMPENCMWPNGFQYSLLQTVVEACQKKKHCKFNATPGTYGIGASGRGELGSSSFNYRMPDPCPRVRKFVEIAYKCRPYEFRSKVACENDIVQLECNPYSRIAVYSASFGRTEYESIQCPQTQGVREETCLASYATETVMQICHGRRRCNLAADANTFGSPCHRNSRMYLKIVYTCVPKQVLKERYEPIRENDEVEDFETDINESYDEDPYYKESEAIPKLQSNSTITASNYNSILGAKSNLTVVNSSSFETSFSSPNPIMTHTMGMYFENDNEKFYITLLLIGTVCILICFVIITRLILTKTRRDSEGQDQSSIDSAKDEHNIQNGYNGSISEIDADIDLVVHMQVPSVSKSENLIRYNRTSSLYSPVGSTITADSTSTNLLRTPANPYIRKSPDILGTSNLYITVPPPGNTESTFTHVSSGMGTIVPVTSLAQYSNAMSTTFNGNPPSSSGYILDGSCILQRPAASITNCHRSKYQQHQKLQSLPENVDSDSTIDHQSPPTSSAGSLSVQPMSKKLNDPKQDSRIEITSPQKSSQQCVSIPIHYDGTLPRTLSTGVAQNPTFYYE